MMCINHLEKAVPCYNMIINICTVQTYKKCVCESDEELLDLLGQSGDNSRVLLKKTIATKSPAPYTEC